MESMSMTTKKNSFSTISRRFRAIFLLLCTGGVLLSAGNAIAGVVINEFMASNTASAADPSGNYDDWIELYNNGSESVSLTGCYLSDNLSKPTKWTFPDVSIAAGGYLIVWADEETDQEGIHAKFKLSADGESIVLSSPTQEVMDQVTFGAQTDDMSMARYPNGTGDFVRMKPTFAAENLAPAHAVGDVNGDEIVDLGDAIMTIQLLIGMKPSPVYLAADANGDLRIGMEEALHVLQSIAACRGTKEITSSIALQTNTIAASGSGVTVSGRTATISSAGTYNISGVLTDGQIIVDTEDSGTVHLVFNGIAIGSSTSAPIYIRNGNNTVITLTDGTENVVTDAASYVFGDGEDEPDAAIFSKSDLTIEGNGALTVRGNYLDGIASKDGLTITGGDISVNAADDGIRGRDYLMITGGKLTVNAIGDGLKSTNDEDAAKGYISIAAGTFDIVSGADAIQAETTVTISGGQFTLTAGGGSSTTIADDASAKGIKGLLGIGIAAGTFTINSADDAIHSNGDIVINGGTFALTSGDDGIHADTSIGINGGDIRISQCYEGIESSIITINDGTIHIVSSDDGLNGAGGVDGSGIDIRPGQGGFTPPAAGNSHLYINGGYLAINAAGDGIDVNGSMDMSGGTVIVHGPTANNNSAVDYDGTFTLTGGFLAAAGSAGMAQTAGASSTQNALLLLFNSSRPAGSLVHIQSSVGKEILTFAPSKTWQAVAFSSPLLTTGTTYNVYYGGSSTGTATDGLYEGGTYTAGTKYRSFTVSGVVTNVR